MAPAPAIPKPCARCKNPDAPYDLRNGAACRNCFVEYVEDKAGRRLGAVGRDTRPPGRPGPRRYLAGLSFGPSSTVMMQLLDICANFYLAKKSSPAFEPLAVHVDTDLSHPAAAADREDGPAQRLLCKYRERFPNISFECVHLSRICTVKTLDWSALGCPDMGEPGGDHVGRLQGFFDSLPSVTSRADILRLFIRHILLDLALERSSSALLLGHSTSALAALTFAEVANGRGFAVPWQINDGPFAVCTYDAQPGSSAGTKEVSRAQVPVYYPLRELFRNEIKIYLDLVPSLKELMPEGDSTASNVVSHKDLSIAEVMERYFDSVEAPQSGIVANVVRTTGKLDRAASGNFCLMCGMTLDKQGDSRWAGELGDDADAHDAASRTAGLCYGCKRSING